MGRSASSAARQNRYTDPLHTASAERRHAFALYMLVALHHALDRRFGLTPEDRRHFRQVYGDPWVLVRDLLGHKSEQTTRLVYLEPLNGLQVKSMLDHDEDLETLLSRVAASSRLVIDADPAGEDEP